MNKFELTKLLGKRVQLICPAIVTQVVQLSDDENDVEVSVVFLTRSSEADVKATVTLDAKYFRVLEDDGGA